MATQGRCNVCHIRIYYGKKCRIPLRRLACPWCGRGVLPTSSNMKAYPTIQRGPEGIWPKQKEELQ